jgi:hypothetical protein
MKAHDPIAGLPPNDLRAYRDDGSGQLVPKNLRRINVAMEDFLDVSATNAACGYLDQHFGLSDFGYRDFLNANNSLFAEDAGAHGFGNRTVCLAHFESCA